MARVKVQESQRTASEKIQEGQSITPEMAAVLEHVRTTAQTFGLDPDLVTAIAEQESNFNPAAVSPKGARGPMQVMPATAKELRTRYGDDNVRQGVGYFKELLERFNNDVVLALAAYNAGPGRLERATQLAALRGTPVAQWLPPETQKYIEGVLAKYEGRKKAQPQVTAAAPTVDPRAAKAAVQYGINAITDLNRLPGFANLSLAGKREVARSFGYDVAAVPDGILESMFGSELPQIPSPAVPGGGPAALAIPGAIATAIENRVVDPIRTAFSPSRDTSMLERGLALGEIAGGVAAPAWLAGNIAAQSALNWMLGDNDLAPFIGAGVELFGGWRSWSAAARRGKASTRAMRQSLAAASQGGMKAEEVIGKQIRSALRGRIAVIKERVSGHRRVAEDYLRRNPHWKADKTLVEYQALSESLDNLWRDKMTGAVSPGLHSALSGLRRKLRAGEDVPVKDLYVIKERLRREAQYVDRLAATGNPPGDRAALSYLGQIRGRTIELLESTLRREPHRAAQSVIKDLNAADRLHEKYVAPAFTFLRTALSAKATPAQAYRALFSMRDPQALRTAIGLMNRAGFAGVRDKIRLGFAKHLADSTADFTDIPKVIRVLKNHEDFLTSHNIYTARELRDMQVFFRKRNITSLRSLFHRDLAATSVFGVAASAGAGALAIGATPMLAARNLETGRYEYEPRNLMIAAMVAGTTPLLFRLGVRPHDPVASTRAAEQVIGTFSTVLRRIAYTSQIGDAALAEVDTDD